MTRHVRAGAVVVVLALLLGACTQPLTGGDGADAVETAQPPVDAASWTELTITQGTVGRVGDLSVGVINVRAKEGSRAASAALSFRSDTAGTETREVALGEQVDVLGRPVFVVAVRTGGSTALAPGSSTASVTVRVGDRRLTGSGPAGRAAPRSAFPSGEEGRLAWVRACLPDRSFGLLLLPDLPYISARVPTPWWETTPHDTRDVRFASGGSATEYVSKDARDPRVSTTFTIRAERWQVDGRPEDPRYRGVVECAYARLEAR